MGAAWHQILSEIDAAHDRSHGCTSGHWSRSTAPRNRTIRAAADRRNGRAADADNDENQHAKRKRYDRCFHTLNLAIFVQLKREMSARRTEATHRNGLIAEWKLLAPSPPRDRSMSSSRWIKSRISARGVCPPAASQKCVRHPKGRDS